VIVFTATLFIGMGLTEQDEAEALTARGKVLRLINRSRAINNLPKLRLNKKVSRYARRHSVRMAQRKTLFHTSDLQRRLSSWDPSAWGENVGCGRWIKSVHRAFMRSSAHRSNILSRSYRRVGVGVVRAPGGSGMCGSGPRFWITQIFYG
jgi:uncharacterized protein YkwD